MDASNKHLKEECERILDSTGQTLTREQEALLDIFCAAESHVTVGELGERMRAAGFTIDDAAVAETLDLFCKCGIAEKKTFEERPAVYEHLHMGRHHDHCVCIQCGNIIEFSNARLEALQDKAAERHGFRPMHHRLEIYGLCEQCAEKRRKSFPLSHAPEGDRLRVVRIIGGHGVHHRLTDLGILPGTELEVVHTTGPFVVAVKGSRVALGHGVVQKIVVEPIEST
jgi:Fur family ferric uptake transcriptional regulator